MGFQMNMTPMIDVTFQLIIFFMTASQMSRLENEQIPLPELKGSSDKEEGDLTINILVDGTMKIGGETTPMLRIEALVRDQIRQKGNRPELVAIVIRADRTGTSAQVNKLFLTLKKLGILQSRIAVTVPGSG